MREAFRCRARCKSFSCRSHAPARRIGGFRRRRRNIRARNASGGRFGSISVGAEQYEIGRGRLAAFSRADAIPSWTVGDAVESELDEPFGEIVLGE